LPWQPRQPFFGFLYAGLDGISVCGCEVPWKTRENVAGDDTSKDRGSRRRENPGDKLQRTHRRHATPRHAAPRRATPRRAAAVQAKRR